MSDNPYMSIANPYMEIGGQASNPYMGLRKKHVPAEETAEDMMSQMVGLNRPQPTPLKETHPTLWAAGKTVLDMPGLIGEAGTAVISGATFSLPERAEEAGEWLSRKLFGEGRKGGATGSWTEEPQLHPYVERGLRFGGQMLTVSALGKTIAAPIINTVMKHRYLAPFARMIGWGTAGATYQAGERMLGEGELPTPQELLKSGGTWAAIEGVMSSLGWTGRLAIGLNRLSKTWTIPKKEVLKIVLKEAKDKGMPFAKYIYAKAGVQKALSLKEKASAKEFLNMVDGLIIPFKKRGTYSDLVKQLEKESVEGRIKSFEKHVNKTIVGQKPKSKLTQRIDMLKMGKTRGRILSEDLPDWVRKVGNDIRYGTPVSKALQKKYHDFFSARQRPGETISHKMPTPKAPIKRPRGDISELIPEKKIKAKSAALKFSDGTVITGQTHADAYNKAFDQGFRKQLDQTKYVSGFVDGSGKFLTRPQMMKQHGIRTSEELIRAEKKSIVQTKVLPKEIRGEVKGYPGYAKVTVSGKEGVTEAGKPKIAIKAKQRQGLSKQKGSSLDNEGMELNYTVHIDKHYGYDKTGKYKFITDKVYYDDIGLNLSAGSLKELKNKITKAKRVPSKGTTLGFGPTGELQNIYEKLMAGRLHKPLKKKVGDAIPCKLSSDAQLVMDVLKKIKPLSAKQKEIYSLERGKRLTEAIKLRGTTSGEHGYHTELKALEGSMEHLEFEPVRKLITQEAVNNLMNEIRDCPVLSNWEVYPARKALAQILQGSMPTEGGQALLRDVFGKKFANELLKKQALWKKIKEAGIMAVNFPKAIKSSYDLSAPLRQGVFMIRRYKQWMPAFRDMFKYFGSKKAYHEAVLGIRKHGNYKLAKDHKLALTDLGSITTREEAFMSPWAEKIPGVGASARAYTGFLNQLRFDVFNDFVKKGQRLGLLKNKKYLKGAAKYINHATGRGHLMGLEGAATELNAVFFSPRLIMSRFQLVNPVFYIKLPKHVRKEALKDLFAFTGLTCSIGALAKMAGLDVEVDPRSADFMKIKVGNKRFDTLGGLQQTIRTVAQFIAGEIISTTTGKTLTLGEGYKPMTRLGVAGRFLQYKLAPVPSFAVTLLTGQATMGGKLDIPTEIGRLFAPMAAQDMYELYDDEGLSAIPLAAPAFFGVGLQTYGGVSTYGLSGKDYKTLNTELSRLKTSLGFPSTSVYGQELTNKEYKVFKNKAGKEIARSVENIMKASFYKEANDDGKRHIVDKVIDHTKEKVKRELFKRYMFIQQRAAAIRKATYKPVQESRKMAKEQVDKLMKEK